MSIKAKTSVVIDRCLAAASQCVEQGNDLSANDRMKAEFRELAREVSRLELGGIKKAGLFLLPMEQELVKKFGRLLGRELYWDFVDSFWVQSWTEVPLDEVKLERMVTQTKEWHWRLLAHRSLRRLLSLGYDFSRNQHRD